MIMNERNGGPVSVNGCYHTTTLHTTAERYSRAAADKKLYHSGESLIILGLILSNVSPGLAGLTGTLLTLTLALLQQ